MADDRLPSRPLTALLPPPILANHTPAMGAVPALGQYTDAVLAELGLSADELAELRAAAAIGP